MSKIAFITNWYSFTKKDNEIISRESLYDDNKFIIESLFKTAKKFFIPNCDIDFIFITNTDTKIDGVKTIKVDIELNNFWHVCLMKILSIKYIQEEYDYYFINDPDQIFIDYVDDDMLKNDFVILNHWHQPIKEVHSYITNKITLNFDESKKEDKWTLGNFFGGKKDYILELVELTEKIHLEYYKDGEDFYTIYPEEIFLIKYLYENNINFKRLFTNEENGEKRFMYVMNDMVIKSLINDIHIPGSTKLLHDTKKYHKDLVKIMKNYE